MLYLAAPRMRRLSFIGAIYHDAKLVTENEIETRPSMPRFNSYCRPTKL